MCVRKCVCVLVCKFMCVSGCVLPVCNVRRVHFPTLTLQFPRNGFNFVAGFGMNIYYLIYSTT